MSCTTTRSGTPGAGCHPGIPGGPALGDRPWDSFTQEDVDYAAKVSLLGQTVVDTLFGAEEPVGQSIRVQKIPCRVVGVLLAKGPTPPW
jgi:hypothetical protein